MDKEKIIGYVLLGAAVLFIAVSVYLWLFVVPAKGEEATATETAIPAAALVQNDATKETQEVAKSAEETVANSIWKDGRWVLPNGEAQQERILHYEPNRATSFIPNLTEDAAKVNCL